MTEQMTMSLTEHEADDILTMSEACQYLKISRATMYRLLDKGEISGRKVGAGRGRYRFSKRALLDWIEETE